jgi:hypothetical protein
VQRVARWPHYAQALHSPNGVPDKQPQATVLPLVEALPLLHQCRHSPNTKHSDPPKPHSPVIQHIKSIPPSSPWWPRHFGCVLTHPFFMPPLLSALPILSNVICTTVTRHLLHSPPEYIHISNPLHRPCRTCPFPCPELKPTLCVPLSSLTIPNPSLQLKYHTTFFQVCLYNFSPTLPNFVSCSPPPKLRLGSYLSGALKHGTVWPAPGHEACTPRPPSHWL